MNRRAPSATSPLAKIQGTLVRFVAGSISMSPAHPEIRKVFQKSKVGALADGEHDGIRRDDLAGFFFERGIEPAGGVKHRFHAARCEPRNLSVFGEDPERAPGRVERYPLFGSLPYLEFIRGHLFPGFETDEVDFLRTGAQRHAGAVGRLVKVMRARAARCPDRRPGDIKRDVPPAYHDDPAAELYMTAGIDRPQKIDPVYDARGAGPLDAEIAPLLKSGSDKDRLKPLLPHPGDRNIRADRRVEPELDAE